jgi:hypothetical protein
VGGSHCFFPCARKLSTRTPAPCPHAGALPWSSSVDSVRFHSPSNGGLVCGQGEEVSGPSGGAGRSQWGRGRDGGSRRTAEDLEVATELGEHPSWC